MSIEFQLPSIGEGVETADIAEILVADGDVIDADQIIMELETDKAVVELPCPHAGRIEKLLVGEGDTVSVGQTLLRIDAAETGNRAPVADSSEEAPQEPSEEEADEAVDAASDPANASAALEADQAEPDQQSAGGEPSSIDFTLPNIGEGVETADVAELYVSVGDEVSADQIVMELETEKAVVELPCSHAGTVLSLNVAAGDTVKVGQSLMTIEGVATGTPEKRSEASPSPARSEGAPAKTDSSKPSTSTASAEPPRTVSVARTPEIITGADNGRPPVPAAPSTRRLARQLGVNLRDVGGTGPGGRITQEDVQEFVKARLTQRLPARTSGGLATIAGGSLAPPPLPDFSKFGDVDREKMSKLARTAAENLSVSWNVIPHVTQHDRADVTELEAARKKFAKGAGADGPKVTMTAIVMKALATALQQHPSFNSSLDPETLEIVYKRYYHIGCAVDTPNGLLVPVVKDVDKKSIRDVAGEIGELAALARDRKLPIEVMQGATCTVTNLGGIGGVAFTPIVNYPEVCILGLARGQQELRLEDGELTERMMLPLSLSYDHRVINGADAARFLVSLCQMLSDPFQLLSAI